MACTNERGGKGLGERAFQGSLSCVPPDGVGFVLRETALSPGLLRRVQAPTNASHCPIPATTETGSCRS